MTAEDRIEELTYQLDKARANIRALEADSMTTRNIADAYNHPVLVSIDLADLPHLLLHLVRTRGLPTGPQTVDVNPQALDRVMAAVRAAIDSPEVP